MITKKDTLIKNIKRDIPDNTVGSISPRDIRQNLIDIVDSIHLLTSQHPLLSKNLYTIAERTTAVGIENFIHLGVEDSLTKDNTAIGYQALNASYRGVDNTAVGSFALSCLINGESNIGVGFHSLAGNINGVGNLGIGNYTLNGNREGNFNVAIGHGAGYYANRDSSYQFFLGIHPVTRDYICDNPEGEGLVPLLFGNLKQSELSLGVGVRSLNEGSILQVEGNLNPHSNAIHNLGSSDYHWNNIYLTNSVEFQGGPSIELNNNRFYFNRNVATIGSLTSSTLNVAINADIQGNTLVGQDLQVNGSVDVLKNFTVYKNFLIEDTNAYQFCNPSTRFLNSFFTNVYAKYIQSDVFEAQRQVHFSNKTLRLGSSSEIYSVDGGGPVGLFDYFDPADTISATPYLSDDDLVDAGIIAHSTTNNSAYEFTFKPFGSLPYAKVSENNLTNNNWHSNISIALHPDSFLNTSHVYGRKNLFLSTFSADSNFDPRISLTNNDTIGIGFSNVSNHATSGDINFLSYDYNFDRFDINVMSHQPGVNIFHRYRTNTSLQSQNGFDIGYISDSSLPVPSFFNEQIGQDPKRFVIRSFLNQEYSQNCFTLMQGDTDGVVGISNFAYSDNMLPDTMLNARSTGDCVARFTAETNGSSKAAVELLTRENCLKYGASLSYYNDSGLFDILSFSNSTATTLLRLDSDGHVAIQPSGFTHENSYEYMLSLGSKQYNNASVAMFESYESFVPSSGYGVLFVRQKGLEDQEHDLKFMDGSGNVFNISMTASAASDVIFDRAVYTSINGATYAGLETPPTINVLDSTEIHNVTAYGYRAFRNLTDSTTSVAIGARVGENFVNGDRNVFIGCPNASITSGSNNFILGANSSTYGGSWSNVFDLDGKITCSDTSSLNAEYYIRGSSLSLNSRIIIAPNRMSYSGTGFLFSQHAFGLDPGSITPTVTYKDQLSINNDLSTFYTDLRLSSKLIFSDNSFIDSASFLNTIALHTTTLSEHRSDIDKNEADIVATNKKIDDGIVEGFVYGGTLTPPSHPTLPTTFQILQYKTINGTWKEVPADPDNDPPRFINIQNRDPGLSVNRGEYVVAQRIGNEYRVVWVSNYRLPTSEL